MSDQSGKNERDTRRAEALRANLRRRKSAQRKATEEKNPPNPTGPDEKNS